MPFTTMKRQNPMITKLITICNVIGSAATRLAGGHVSIRGEVEMDDVYDDAGTWLAAKAKADDGSTIEYRRV